MGLENGTGRQRAQTLNVGVLALQGGFSEHVSHLKKAASFDVNVRQVRTATDCEGLDGLVIPGGESSTMRRMLLAAAAKAAGDESEDVRLYEALVRLVRVEKRPVFGTCAGLIMLANSVEGEEPLMGGLDVHVVRNYYGAQPQSFEGFVTVAKPELESEPKRRMIFIRAPRVVSILESKQAGQCPVTPLAWHGDSVVALQQGNILVTAFHPELTPDLSWHSYFLKLVAEYAENN